MGILILQGRSLGVHCDSPDETSNTGRQRSCPEDFSAVGSGRLVSGRSSRFSDRPGDQPSLGKSVHSRIERFRLNTRGRQSSGGVDGSIQPDRKIVLHQVTRKIRQNAHLSKYPKPGRSLLPLLHRRVGFESRQACRPALTLLLFHSQTENRRTEIPFAVIPDPQIRKTEPKLQRECVLPRRRDFHHYASQSH